LTDTESLSDFALASASILPSLSEIESAMGYGSAGMPEFFSGIVSDLLKAADGLIAVRCAVAEPDIGERSPEQGWIEIGGSRFTVGRRIVNRMARAERAVVFACTIGPCLGERSRESSERGEAFEAYALDAIASQAAENAAEALQRLAEERAARRDLGATERYSPGYCGWPVSEQRTLFGLLPAGACGIALTESSMMVPEKSVSGFFGIGQGLRRSAYGCGDCDRLSCPSRAIAAALRKKRPHGA
jgi:hypothetical protein